ncbi:FAD-binding protein [Roseomonas sp. JC162]|uniref:FAD-binding protein n=1 Tax=Neoroseomonas marina TaxID=1232220 RepID=A0A848EKD1_9PROT|nr:GMC family oxidoreductase N-terminal domain-containing protein [Neoroseomonas marina]NMJ43853.1 FAD-binding protein [Neoroseomonas marina]
MDTDYLVIGAGSAGCVVAARLSETGARVTLLEAGPKDRHPWIHIPAGMLKLLQNQSLMNWGYVAEPQPGVNDREIRWPRGRTLGGTSSINGMLYVRGNPADFDIWAQMGCRGWSFDEVLPFFRKSETYRNGGDPEFRGTDGPLQVEDYRTILPLTHRFIEAAQQAGHPFRKDLNGEEQEGVGYSQMTRVGRWRGSTARTYLRGAGDRVRVETEAQVSRLVFDGRRCIGAEFRQGGAIRRITVTREVILCGGAVNSPHVLQMSGIGPAEHLRSLGIEVLADMPAVGANLQDHYVSRVQHRVKDGLSTNQLARGIRLAGEVARFFLRGNGALTFGVTTAQVFARSREGLASPDLQLLFTPASYALGQFGVLEKEPGMTCAICPVKPDSRGTVMARSADPFEKPAIRPNYLSARSDQALLAAGIRMVREIFAQPAIAQHSVQEILPGPGVASDDEILAFNRQYGTTIYHPVGTCRMGEGPDAVVDSRLRVHGFAGLRVIDASVMPTLTTGNTNAPTIMIGEKGAAMIREDAAA